MSVHKHFRNIVTGLLDGLESTTGQAFLDRFASQVAALFGADNAVIACIDDADAHCLRIVAMHGDQRIVDSRAWSLAGSPNAVVIDSAAPCIFRSRVRDRFPADEVLRHTAAACYTGVPLLASEGEIVGVIALTDRQSIADDELAADILQLFADRVSAEIERLASDAQYRYDEQALEARLHRCGDDLAKTRHELEALAHGVSHDLRGPLRAIDGFSEILLSDCADRLDQTAVNYLRRIRSNAMQMDGLLQALLLLSRVTRHRLQRERINLSKLCDRHLARLRQQDPQRRVLARVEPDVYACADAELVAVALGQLLDNAWKFSVGSDPARIEFATEQRDDLTIYRLDDNGAGFDMAYLDKLFELFQRLHGQQDFPGVGAGLAAVKRIVERHGGTIWAQATPGRGASFRFTLPAQAGDDASPAVSDPA